MGRLPSCFSLAPAESPCFHSHSRMEPAAPVPVGVLNCYRVLPSRYRTEGCLWRQRSFRRDIAVTRTRRWVVSSFTSRFLVFSCYAAADLTGAPALFRNGS